MFGRYPPGLRKTIDLLHKAEKKPLKVVYCVKYAGAADRTDHRY